MTSQSTTDHDFALLVAAAVKGERCPQTRPWGPLPGSSVTTLIRSGKIRVEIFTRNFRRVTILDGEFCGKCTASPASGSQVPWKVIDQNGTRTSRGTTPHRSAEDARDQPSRPRPLPPDYFK